MKGSDGILRQTGHNADCFAKVNGNPGTHGLDEDYFYILKYEYIRKYIY